MYIDSSQSKINESLQGPVQMQRYGIPGQEYWQRHEMSKGTPVDTPQEIPQARSKANKFFIIKIYITSSVLFICAVVQWTILTRFQWMVYIILSYNYCGLAILVVAYLLLLAFICFRQQLIRRSSIFDFSFMILTTEFGTVVVTQPIAEANYSDLIYAAVLPVVVLGISVILSLRKPTLPGHKPRYLIMWTVRYFLISSMGIIVAMAMENVYIEIGLATLNIFFLVIFTIFYGKDIGSEDFFNAKLFDWLLHGVLGYYNLLTLYSNCLLFFEKCRFFT